MPAVQHSGREDDVRGRTRTGVNYYKVSVRVYACVNPACEHGYANAEVLD